ncbi:aminomethyl-transferring glycine dehydrogenase, partial [Saprospiraceae bacterium]|nr:aminomethyl-transferring glycine dehydrogenase [Saprospiraceae bacterium]
FSTHEKYKRLIPGRIIGVSVDTHGDRALRMALQTREQHIRREKATSNICTAQALLAIMAGMYAVYHGQDGVRSIAQSIQEKTNKLVHALKAGSFNVTNTNVFDTIHIAADQATCADIKAKSEVKEINFAYTKTGIQVSLDETVSEADLRDIADVFSVKIDDASPEASNPSPRTSEFLAHPVFNMYHTETKMMRYIKSLENKDLSLMHSMIALGSCTMKLNAAAELMPVSWPEFADIHPFAPLDQTGGYQQMLDELSAYLSDITGFTACSLQPNSGAQGEYAGLMTIAAYHRDNNGGARNKILIPTSAHGTNPASGVMAGMKVVLVKCDDEGNIDIADLAEKCELHKETLAGLMVTYPSTHGVFEAKIKEMCDMIHDNGGLVYMDGANMNAQVGLTSPGHIHADVCHLNLHKTFAIPHGGGGPGMGPICVNDTLAPYLPSHVALGNVDSKRAGAVSAAPYGSASILLISYGYIRMLGGKGMKDSTKIAILNANYMKSLLEDKFDVLYTGEKGRAAHELIIDLRKFKAVDVSAEDIAKRLIDYGFHSPTLSFPVAGTLMIEPTESESKDELDRFCHAMLSIHNEIDEIARGEADEKNNVLRNAPHTLKLITEDEWNLPYARSKAAYPLEYLKHGSKFWCTVGRVDNAYGDRNLICTCPPIESYAEEV